jgi:hypothetical protein
MRWRFVCRLCVRSWLYCLKWLGLDQSWLRAGDDGHQLIVGHLLDRDIHPDFGLIPILPFVGVRILQGKDCCRHAKRPVTWSRLESAPGPGEVLQALPVSGRSLKVRQTRSGRCGGQPDRQRQLWTVARDLAAF